MKDTARWVGSNRRFLWNDQAALITGGATELQAGATSVDLSMNRPFPQCKLLLHMQQKFVMAVQGPNARPMLKVEVPYERGYLTLPKVPLWHLVGVARQRVNLR